MIAIINGKLYDTRKAELIGTGNEGDIYRTKKGNWFMINKSGRIRAMTEEDIKEFLGTWWPEKYIELFGEPEEA